ncbi:MAG: hypothetical protein K9J13_14225, partial [Saprospiraceae bacterium]|nr:hypothetical protein [Saprospiraceae bacterium]
MKKLYIIIFVFLFTGCNFINNSTEKPEEQKGIKRKFALREFNYGVEIYLNEDFSFINSSYTYGCTGGYRIKEVRGKYELDSNQIKFIPQKLIWKEDWEEHYFNSKKTFDTVAYYISDSTKIQNNYWYLKSNNIEFLISDATYGEHDEFFIKSSNFIALANLYNMNADEKINSYVFCNSDTILNLKTTISKIIIPEKNKAMFFDEPKEFHIK